LGQALPVAAVHQVVTVALPYLAPLEFPQNQSHQGKVSVFLAAELGEEQPAPASVVVQMVVFALLVCLMAAQ